MSFDWVPGVAAGLFTGALGFWRKTGITEAVLKANVEALREEFKLSRDTDERLQSHVHAQFDRLQQELRDAAAEFRTASMAIAKLSSSQEVINTVTGKALESLVRRQEEHAAAISDSVATIRLLDATMKRIQETRA